MSGRISLFIVALVVLTGHQRTNSQTAGNHNGFDLVPKRKTFYQLLDVLLNPKGGGDACHLCLTWCGSVLLHEGKDCLSCTFQRSQPTGYTFKVTQSSSQSKQSALAKPVSQSASQGEWQCKSIC